ncbi:MAG: hypothetical protein AB7E47_05960 [Desulfovibrionaceae bacterium]
MMWKNLLQRALEDREGRAMLERWLAANAVDCPPVQAAGLAEWIAQQLDLVRLDAANKTALTLAAQWLNATYAPVTLLITHRLGEPSTVVGLAMLEAIDRLVEMSNPGVDRVELLATPVFHPAACAHA